MGAKARIVVITGPGRGKTTSALGILMRSLSYGKSALLVRFAKAAPSGELNFLAAMPGVAVVSGNRGMTPPPAHPDFPAHVAEAERLFEEVRAQAARHDVLVLDEICGAVARKLIPEQKVTTFLARLRSDQIAVLTGRDAGLGLIAMADTVSEIECVKHGYARGVEAQKGVEL